MKLKEFLKMWRDDPVIKSVSEAEKTEGEGKTAYLFHVLYKDRTDAYGRHAGLRVQVDKKEEVKEHDIFNMTIDNNGNWVEAIRTWYFTWVNSTADYTTSTTSAFSTGTYNGSGFAGDYYISVTA